MHFTRLDGTGCNGSGGSGSGALGVEGLQLLRRIASKYVLLPV